jgi:hypothetical protein
MNKIILNKNIAYTLGSFVDPNLAAHGIRIGAEWQDMATASRPEIIEFAGKVDIYPHPGFGKQVLKTPGAHLCKIDVAARGRTFSEERIFSRGTPGTEFALIDREVEDKFRHNAASVLNEDRIDGAVRAILELETIDKASELVGAITV